MLCFRETAFGRVGIEDKEGFITRLYLPGRSDAVSEGPETPLLGEAFAQLEAYFPVGAKRLTCRCGLRGRLL